MTTRSDRYELNKRKRRKIITLSGTVAGKITQVKEVLKPYYIDHYQENGKWVLQAKRPNGSKVTIINSTKIECLKDLLTIHNYEYN